MSMVKVDFGAETRPLERYMPRGKGEWYEVDCPFCGQNQLVQTRKFHQGVRCQVKECRAMLYFCTHQATRDMLPREHTVMIHGLRTRIG
jgi:phage terminase large subunit GpA-like protein